MYRLIDCCVYYSHVMLYVLFLYLFILYIVCLFVLPTDAVYLIIKIVYENIYIYVYIWENREKCLKRYIKMTIVVFLNGGIMLFLKIFASFIRWCLSSFLQWVCVSFLIKGRNSYFYFEDKK